MRKRAEDVEDTRRRIVEAAVHLHGTVGPANTTISGVADEAGVQRSTVYRHFPDDDALFGACTSHWFAAHPWPRPTDWAEESDPIARLRAALRRLYAYYEANQQMISNSIRDMEVMPSFVGELMRAQDEQIRASLIETWGQTSHDERLEHAIAHAIDFRAWQSLASAGLEPDVAAELMADMVGGLATQG